MNLLLATFAISLLDYGICQDLIFGRSEYRSFTCPNATELALPEDCPYFIVELKSDNMDVVEPSSHFMGYTAESPFSGGVRAKNIGTATVSCYVRCGVCGDIYYDPPKPIPGPRGNNPTLPMTNGNPTSLVDPSVTFAERKTLQQAQKALAEHDVKTIKDIFTTGKLGIKMETRVMSVLETYFPEIAETVKTETLAKLKLSTTRRPRTTKPTPPPAAVGILPQKPTTRRTTTREATTRRPRPSAQEEPLPAVGESGPSGRVVSIPGGPAPPDVPYPYTLAPPSSSADCPEYFLGSQVLTVMNQAVEYRRGFISSEGVVVEAFDVDIPGVTRQSSWGTRQGERYEGYYDGEKLDPLPEGYEPDGSRLVLPQGENGFREIQAVTTYGEPVNMRVIIKYSIPAKIPDKVAPIFWHYASPVSAGKANLTINIGGVEGFQLQSCPRMIATYHTSGTAYTKNSTSNNIVFEGVPDTGFLCVKGEDPFVTESCKPVMPQDGQACGNGAVPVPMNDK